MKFPSEVEECSALFLVDSLVLKQFEKGCKKKLQFEWQDNSLLKDKEEEECVWVETKQNLQFEPLDTSLQELKLPKSSVEEPPVLELKPLPSHMRYAYLGEVSTLLVIVLAQLFERQKV